MRNLLQRLWNDDQGAIISVEMILIIGILIFGIIPGLVALRNSVNAAYGTIGNILTELVPSFTYSGFAIGCFSGGGTIALVEGYQVNPVTTDFLTASQVPPIVLSTLIVIPPCP